MIRRCSRSRVSSVISTRWESAAGRCGSGTSTNRRLRRSTAVRAVEVLRSLYFTTFASCRAAPASRRRSAGWALGRRWGPDGYCPASWAGSVPETCSTAVRSSRPTEALAYGLVDEVVEPERLEARALEYAAELSVHPPLGIRATKRLLNVSADMPLDRYLEREWTSQLRLFAAPATLAAFDATSRTIRGT